MIHIPGSKSYTNRALIIAALTKGPVSLKNPLYSDDTEALIECLKVLGLKIENYPDQIIVHDDISSVQNKEYHLFARDSGTTMRFILALSCIVPGVKILKGNHRLNERPIKDLVDALRQLGAGIEYMEKEGQLPLRITSSQLSGTEVFLKGDISSQFCSALLLISPHFSKGLTLSIQGKQISKPYIDMTIDSMQEAKVKVVKQDGKYMILENQSYQKEKHLIEGDYSSAGYFFAIAALTRSTITLKNLQPNSLQADKRFLDILIEMGNRVHYEKDQIRFEGKNVSPIDVNMEDCPDQVMTMAVLAAFAKGTTKISGVRSLRVKETERVVAIKNELGKMGIRTEDTQDTLTIYGGSPKACEIETYNDHRMAMSFAVAKTCLKDLVIRSPHVVNKTFPNFWEVFGSLV